MTSCQQRCAGCGVLGTCYEVWVDGFCPGCEEPPIADHRLGSPVEDGERSGSAKMGTVKVPEDRV